MVEVTTVKRIVGRIDGTVIDQNIRQREAPSSVADSYMSFGTDCIA